MATNVDYRESSIYESFKLLTTVTRQKCIKCGCVDELNLHAASGLLRIMGVLGAFPEISLVSKEDFKKYYFETNYCGHCINGKEGDLTIEIKELKFQLK
ncbi:MAG: hypothetical protein WCK37_04020 [Candidatus Falkowbacteria bacterium]